jgi:type IV pilus assembly protein PilE
VKYNKGFTLIEMLIVVAIIGVLAAIAYPSYTDSQIKGNRAAAKTYLLEVTQKQQQFLLDNRAYGTDAEIQALAAPPPEVTRFYNVLITPDNTGTPPSFTARATPIATTRQAKDGWLQIDQTGKKESEKPDKW